MQFVLNEGDVELESFVGRFVYLSEDKKAQRNIHAKMPRALAVHVPQSRSSHA